MTKKELIRNLMNSEIGTDEEMLVSVIYQENEGGVPILTTINYVFDQFINITIDDKVSNNKNLDAIRDACDKIVSYSLESEDELYSEIAEKANQIRSITHYIR